MLTIKNINTYYGQVHALKNVSLHLQEGEIVTLIGANGAGKTTLLNTISGIVPPKSGQILFSGTPIHELPPTASSRWASPRFPKAGRSSSPFPWRTISN